MGQNKKSSNFFLSILENSNDLISIIDAEGYYLFVGGSVKSILGYAPQEMVGLCAFNYLHEEDIPMTAAALENALHNKVTLLPNFRFSTKSGEWRWLECTITNMVNNPDIQGYVTNSRDVTERVIEEQRKKKSQAHYESLFYNHPEGVFELDRQGFFTHINRRVSEISGYDEFQLLQTHFNNFVHPNDQPRAMACFRKALSGQTQYLDLCINRQNGEVADLSLIAVPVIIDAQVESIQVIAKDITLRKKYEAQLKTQAEQLNSIMEQMPACFYSLDSNWCFTFVNAFYAAYMGKPINELVGKNIWEVYPESTKTRFYQECLQVARTGNPANFEEGFSQRNGTTLSFQIFPTGTGISVHFVDITEKKRKQDELEKLSLVASKTTTCVMVMNADERIEWVNEAFEQVTGYALKECFMKHPSEFLVGEETQAEARLEIRRKLGSKKAYKGEILNYTKSGQKLWFNLEITPVKNDAGTVTKFISIRTDITEKKLKEQELMQVTRDLVEQNRDLQKFSYMVSHNLRAPAANVMGLVDILNFLNKDSEEFAETLSRIKISAQNLDGVIRDMNLILSMRENTHALEKEEVNIFTLCHQALASVQNKLNGCPFNLSVNINKDLVLFSNKAYLFEIMKHLFSNAIKFRKRDEALNLAVRVQPHLNQMEIIVKDNGIGMDTRAIKNDLFQLYKKFHRGYAGRGIGLFLVKTYVEALGGSIKVESQPGLGTTFNVNLITDAK